MVNCPASFSHCWIESVGRARRGAWGFESHGGGVAEDGGTGREFPIKLFGRKKHCETQHPTNLFATSQDGLLPRAGSKRRANLQLKSPFKC